MFFSQKVRQPPPGFQSYSDNWALPTVNTGETQQGAWVTPQSYGRGALPFIPSQEWMEQTICRYRHQRLDRHEWKSVCCPSALPGLSPGRERGRGYMVGKEKRVTQEAKQTVTRLRDLCPDLLHPGESSFDGCGMKAGEGPRTQGSAGHMQAPGVRQVADGSCSAVSQTHGTSGLARKPSRGGLSITAPTSGNEASAAMSSLATCC